MEHILHSGFSSPPITTTGWNKIVINTLLAITLGFLLLSQASSCEGPDEGGGGTHSPHDLDHKVSVVVQH